MKNRLLKLTLLSFAAVSLIAFSGCKKQTTGGEESQGASSSSSESAEAQSGSGGESKVVKISYVNWAEGVALSQLVEEMLTNMGYEVKLTMADVGPIYASVAKGDQDVMLETWMPVTHKDYWDQYSDDFEQLGVWFENAKIGLVVPEYMEISSITELNSIKDKLKGQITGIDAGAGITKTTETAIEKYGLDYTLLTSSGPAMTASLKSAIDKNNPIVVTGWAPHWKFARYDLKFLDDPKGVYGSAEEIRMTCREGFKEDMPKVAEFLSSIKFNNAQIGTLMDAMANADGDKKAALKAWMAENQQLINSWK
ncbi:glycine betaine ABC transporter substrate-binding protein [Sedimentisphaera salicampi]|uniref:Glycine betaine-binding protein OpuAC n=1 Tax=Sedimentisphaera salicampi TaxID=1941349 RepID=A0A1W6LM40_9BACT|nr:glycine betaine ABC transporter substrate-binding protein [Sedimentisphaera salicampi]ARN56822.1 Glycine betaine-binding protein OpuAC precursor [Sedimentisphaera salicampi]OXU14999.1 Glycine betaine-binding protein OpuAC precursor [Sedimentisphaera salicampi]